MHSETVDAPVLVSVVLPTYNRAGSLGRSIESVLAQSYRHFELIVVDDGSTDHTTDVASRYTGDSRVRLLARPHRGCAATRNAGVAASTGRYVAFQDSDDEWLPGKLAAAIRALERTGPEVGVFYSDMLWIKPAGTEVAFVSPDISRGVLVNPDTMDYAVYKIGIQSAVVKRECFERVGFFDEALPRLIDLDFFIRLSAVYEFVHHREPLVRFQDGGGISTNPQALLAARYRLLEKYRRQLEERPEYIAMQHSLIAAAALECGDRRVAKARAIESLKASRAPAVEREAIGVLAALNEDRSIVQGPGG